MRQRITLAVVTGLALLVPSGIAAANPSQFTTIEAPAELTNGNPEAGLDTVEELGADGIRILVGWGAVAPNAGSRTKPTFNATDPDAYPPGSWARYDSAINGARERGLRVHVSITGAPRWATRKGDGLTSPNATEFGKFATAAGRRYGRLVSWWSIWNEPNLGKLLKPIARNQSATVYRNLYLRGYSGLRSAGVRAPILVGELAPQGNSLRDIGTIAPLSFLRSMLCLDRNYRSVRVNGKRCGTLPTQGFAMHPYSTGAGPFLVPINQDNVTIGVLSRLTRALDRAASAGAIARRLPIFITEFGVQSYPDRRLGVPLDVQSDYRSIAEYLAYTNSRVKSFSQYLLRDDNDTTGMAYGAFESGLFLYTGRPKPALHSFRLPLTVVAARGSTTRATLWGLVRPAKQARRAGSITIEYADRGRGWRVLGTQRFGSTGYWRRSVTTNRNRAFRAKWRGFDGRTYVGPRTIARTAAPTA